MTTNHSPIRIGEPCRLCAHNVDDHELWLVLTAPPAGIVTCPAFNCSCLATWGATAARSTATQRVHIRDQVAAALRASGQPDLAARVTGLGA